MLRLAYTLGSAGELADLLCGGRCAALARTDRSLSHKPLDFMRGCAWLGGGRSGANRRAVPGRLEKVQEKL